ncbi:MAG: CRTAC1 family protein [Bradymonadia bacterium]
MRVHLHLLILLVSLPALASGQVGFVDATQEAGVDYLQYELPEEPRLREAWYESGGAVAGDCDNDGDVDLFATRLFNTDVLFVNNGDGTFVEGAAEAGIVIDQPTNGAAWGDIDNDGDLDLYVSVMTHNRYYLFINDGRCHFTEEANARGAERTSAFDHQGFSITFGDVDRDGWLDAFTTAWSPRGVVPGTIPENGAALMMNLGALNPGHFRDETNPRGLEIDPTLGFIPGLFSFTARIADLDNDGWPDLALAGDFGTSRLFFNEGQGIFVDTTEASQVGTDENGMGAALGDYDNDGDLDWFVTSISDENETCDGEGNRCFWGYSGNRLYRNDGDRVFTDVTDEAGVREGFWGWGTTFFDYDNDGDLDLVMTNGFDVPNYDEDDIYNEDPMRFWQNNGDGTFTEVSDAVGIEATDSGKGLLTFDYDNDGDLDLFVVHNTGHPVLYRNEGGNQNPWLRVRVRGLDSNRDGIGARVWVGRDREGPLQLRERQGGSNFLSQDEPIEHFGLGDLPMPGAGLFVRVVFPATGRVVELDDVAPNQTIEVVEPPPVSPPPCELTEGLPCLRRQLSGLPNVPRTYDLPSEITRLGIIE